MSGEKNLITCSVNQGSFELLVSQISILQLQEYVHI